MIILIEYTRLDVETLSYPKRMHISLCCQKEEVCDHSSSISHSGLACPSPRWSEPAESGKRVSTIESAATQVRG